MSDMNTLIAEHWTAKTMLDAAKKREKDARDALSDFLCKDEDSLKNKTIALSGGVKLKHEVLRSLRVNKAHPAFAGLESMLTPQQLAKLVKTKVEVSYSYSAYKDMPTETIQYLSQFLTTTESVTLKYEQKADNR